tara:strand:+ start:306 stop:536 length:231 start_codon:yes stop_codon:yes gene_type:complete
MTDKPPHWPDDVERITLEQLDRLGVHRDSNALHWDGKEVVTTSKVRLGKIELWFAGTATASTLGMFILALIEFFYK